MNSALRQVLIEATIVEVNLNDDYQAGVDWSKISIGGGFSFAQSMLGGNLSNAPSFSMSYASTPNGDNLLATVKLLSQFGDSKVLSSPKLMVLNNQTALLKVVDNRVYFTTTVTTDTTQGVSTSTIETEVHTVPVGFVMSVTPQISSDKMVTLNARPTISRIVGFVKDPNPTLADAGVESLIPEVQVREIESMLKIASGDIGVIGGLMQDTVNHSTSGLPGVARVKLLGDLVSYKENSFRKTELVIFLRPVVIHTASVTADLDDFGRYLSALPAAEAGAK
jgi:general secretion pathway protein D